MDTGEDGTVGVRGLLRRRVTPTLDPADVEADLVRSTETRVGAPCTRGDCREDLPRRSQGKTLGLSSRP